ncbi:MAG: helix-turn-helix transcriptional regulator [Clostridia bacterium]|nr:helix-turn-helix transcriptional regulator [Clostridia bacterium]
MKLTELNPFIRFAGEFEYDSGGLSVKARDCRLFYILDGQGEIIVKNQHLALNRDTVVFLPSESIYIFKTYGPLKLISLNFDLTYENADLHDIYRPMPCEFEIEPCPSDCTDEPFEEYALCEDASEFLHELKSILSEFEESKIYYREICSGMLKEVLLKLMRHDAIAYNKSKNVIDDVISYISQNYTSELTNSSLASKFGYHEYHLNRLFFRYTGMTIHKYVINKRISEAKRLILGSELSLSEVSERVGFNNYSFFSSYFKKTCGVSPLQFKKSASGVSP